MSEKLESILYIEDDLDIAKVTKMILEKLGGFNVVHCVNGIEGIENFLKKPSQLILLDVMMPGMDGVETYNKIRELPEGSDLPIIFITAKAQKHEYNKYLAIGAIAVIIKPFDTFTLVETILKQWEKHNLLKSK